MKYQDSLNNLAKYSWFSLGGAALSGEGAGYGLGRIEPELIVQTLNFAIEAGVTHIDCAPIYGFGRCEQLVGEILAQKPVKIISKGGVSWHDNKRVNMSNEPKIIEKQFFETLKRVKRDVLDCYLIHWPDEKVDIRKPYELLSQLKQKGLVKRIGLSNTNLEDLQLAQKVDDVDVIQGEFNFFSTTGHSCLKDYLVSHKIDFIGWGTLDQGVLTGRVTKDRQYDRSDFRAKAKWWKRQDFLTKFHKRDVLLKVLKAFDFHLFDFIYSFQFYHGLQTSLISIKSPKDLRPLLEVKLIKQEDFEQIIASCMLTP